MTTQEFSNAFDTLLHSYLAESSFGRDASVTNLALDEYEKSQYLTDAQEQLVLSYYNGKNSYLESFEQTEEMRRYLGTLVRTRTLDPVTDHVEDLVITKENSTVFTLPDKLWFITYEQATFADDAGDCASGKTSLVVPVTQDDLAKTLENPFKGPGLRRVLRLDIEDNQIELISKYKVAKYTVRYLEYISPIILTDLDDGLSINGETERTECAFPVGLHRTILELAVALAKAAYKTNN